MVNDSETDERWLASSEDPQVETAWVWRPWDSAAHGKRPYRWRQSSPQVLGVTGSGAGSSTGGWGAPERQGGMGGATDS